MINNKTKKINIKGGFDFFSRNEPKNEPKNNKDDDYLNKNNSYFRKGNKQNINFDFNFVENKKSNNPEEFIHEQNGNIPTTINPLLRYRAGKRVSTKTRRNCTKRRRRLPISHRR